MTHAEQIEKNLAWWRDHGPDVRHSSAMREMGYRLKASGDSDFAFKEKLGDSMAWRYAKSNGLDLGRAAYRKPLGLLPGGELTDLGDRIGRVLDNDGLGFVDSLAGYESQKNHFIQTNAETQFAEFCAEETGMELSEKEHAKQSKSTRAIRRQSKAIAEKLKAAGEALIAEMFDIVASTAAPVSAYELDVAAAAIRADFAAYREDGYKLFVYWIHSKTLEELPSYRRNCLLPYIAAMTRAPKLAALEFFIQNHTDCRFWTFTTGGRCVAEEIPDRLDWMFGKLRELNKELNARWGVQIVFRTTEFGTLEADEDGNRIEPMNARSEQMLFDERGLVNAPGRIERNEQGRALYHPHAHCVVWSSRGFIGKEKWSAMFDFIHAYWRRDGQKIVWLADGIIRDARECCKYVTKPGDIINLPDLELAAFARAVSGRRLVRPLGILAEEIRNRRECGRILRRKRKNGKTVWIEALNHNRLTAETEEEKAARENLQDAYAFTEECEMMARLAPPSAPGKLDGGRFVPKAKDVDVTSVMARIGPAAGPTPLKEPRVIVMTNRLAPDMAAVTSHPLVDRLWCDTVEQWEAGRVLSGRYNVHTGTLTGGENDDGPDLFADPPFLETAETAQSGNN